MATELAVQGTHGEWELIGDFASQEAAIAEAVRLASDTGGAVHHDDAGTVVFGVSTDPNSGHYETRVEVYQDGSHSVL